MGYYTEFMVKLELRKDVPQLVIDTIEWMMARDKDAQKPEGAPDLGQRMALVLTGGSAFHITFDSKFYFDDIAGRWILAANSSFKNYDDETDKFIKWITPYVASGTDGVVGYTQVEEYDIPPQLIRLGAAGSRVEKVVASDAE